MGSHNPFNNSDFWRTTWYGEAGFSIFFCTSTREILISCISSALKKSQNYPVSKHFFRSWWFIHPVGVLCIPGGAELYIPRVSTWIPTQPEAILNEIRVSTAECLTRPDGRWNSQVRMKCNAEKCWVVDWSLFNLKSSQPSFKIDPTKENLLIRVWMALLSSNCYFRWHIDQKSKLGSC